MTTGVEDLWNINEELPRLQVDIAALLETCLSD